MDMYQEIAELLGHEEEPPLIPPAGDDVQGAISLENALPSWKWEPRTPLRDGIAHTIRSYLEMGVQETHTHLRIGEKNAS